MSVVGYGYKAVFTVTAERMVRFGPAMNGDFTSGGWLITESGFCVSWVPVFLSGELLQQDGLVGLPEQDRVREVAAVERVQQVVDADRAPDVATRTDRGPDLAPVWRPDSAIRRALLRRP
jgi:hypothetical protein